MLNTLKQRLEARREDEKGFTLIELMVVVLIIAILLAIAIPTFLGARNTANARAAQSDLRNALTAEQTYYASNQTFAGTDSTGGFDANYPGDIQGIEPNLAWAAAKSTSVVQGTPNQILPTLIGAQPQEVVELTIVGNDHNCYSVAQFNQAATVGTTNVPAGTYYYVAPATGSPLTCSPADMSKIASPAPAHAGPASAPAWGMGW
jgi:type IV pilus assembly protein PilA